VQNSRQFTIRKVKPEDAQQVAAIYNQGINERCATFNTAHVDADEILEKISASKDRFPFLVATPKNSNNIAGWISISPYSARTCYAGIGEVSVYIQKNHRRQGIAETLMKTAFKAAEQQGYWKLMARIFTFNQPSRALFKKQGYTEIGVHKKHGKLEGKWLDVVEVEKLIPNNII